MTPIEHYRKAEKLLDEGAGIVRQIKEVPPGPGQDARRDALGKQVMGVWAQAQVHATLATAVGRGRYIVDGAGHVEPLSGVGPV